MFTEGFLVETDSWKRKFQQSQRQTTPRQLLSIAQELTSERESACGCRLLRLCSRRWLTDMMIPRV
jgi:hypothetical protein